MDYKQYSDQELVALLKGNDYHSFNEIYKRYWAPLFRHARKMLNDDDEASDIVQDIFTTIWVRSADLESGMNLSAYLYSAVRHKVFTLMNRSKLKMSHLKSLEEFIEKGVFTTDEWLNERELAACIEAEVALLPKKMRSIFEMSRKEYLSYQEIAEKLSVSDHTVRKQISNAIKLLKTKLTIFVWLLV